MWTSGYIKIYFICVNCRRVRQEYILSSPRQPIYLPHESLETRYPLEKSCYCRCFQLGSFTKRFWLAHISLLRIGAVKESRSELIFTSWRSRKAACHPTCNLAICQNQRISICQSRIRNTNRRTLTDTLPHSCEQMDRFLLRGEIAGPGLKELARKLTLLEKSQSFGVCHGFAQGEGTNAATLKQRPAASPPLPSQVVPVHRCNELDS